MSRNRLSFDRSNMSILNDSSIGLQNIGRDSVKHPIRNSSYDGTKMAAHKAEDLQHLKKRNAYLQSMIGKIADDRRSVSNVSDLSQENMELRMQRDQYLDQLTKNEDMLWKAREVISHLKSDIHLEALSKNLLQNNGQQNSAIVKPPRNETEISAAISARSDQKVKELTKKLQMRDTQIQELNQMISQVNLENHNLQTKLIKALEKIKELKTKNQNKGDTSFADHSQIQSAKSDLQKKLDSALQSNYDLFNNYTKIMKDNSELQTKMFSLEEEIMKLRGTTIDKNSNFSLIKATESKVENLEQNISRIEETSFILPQIEQKFNSLKNLHKDKMDAIKLAIQLFHQEVSSTIQSLARNDKQLLSELNISQNVLTNINSTRGDGKPTFNSFMNSIQNYEVREILEQLQPVKILKPLIQNLMRYFYDLSVEKFHNNVMRNVVFLERKISNIEKLKVSQKKSNVFQNRSKSALVGRKSLNVSSGHGHAGYHESNKENSFVNILNNSRF